MRSRVRLSAEERSARLDDAAERLTAAVQAVATSDDWRRYLQFAARFHRYSARNMFLLLQQAYQRGWVDSDGSPTIGHVAGYRTWQAMGRQVRKGERGLAVLAPCTYKRTDEKTGEETFAIRGFRVEHVFADCQTDGDDIPAPIMPQLLTGEGPDGAWQGLAALVEAEGFSVARESLFPANGLTIPERRRVVVADRLEGAAAVKTLAHELAHVRLHMAVDYTSNRERCECEAESVAYLVCKQLGLDAGGYSFTYVAHWASGDPAVVQRAADAALKCSREILACLTAEEDAAENGEEVTVAA